ncbi:MAG: hypothetical protein ACOX7J_00730 [Bacillota bacterium]|jgi:hypothetical protein
MGANPNLNLKFCYCCSLNQMPAKRLFTAFAFITAVPITVAAPAAITAITAFTAFIAITVFAFVSAFALTAITTTIASSSAWFKVFAETAAGQCHVIVGIVIFFFVILVIVASAAAVP